MFCSVVEMSRPSAVADDGNGEPVALRAKEMATATNEEIMAAEYGMMMKTGNGNALGCRRRI
jgi:hypothetical protein